MHARSSRAAFRRTTTIRHAALTALVALALVAFAGTATAGENLWLHLHVQEDAGATVKVNLPIAFVETVAKAIPASIEADALSLNDENISVADLREMWASLGDTGDALLVDVADDGESVRVRKTGGYLLVEVQDGRHFNHDGSTVDVRIPERVVEALLAGNGNQLDIAGALRALAEAGEGELVAVNERDTRVRIWVDGFAATE